MECVHLLDFVHELDVLLQLPAHQGQQLFIFLLQHHRRHAALKKLGDKHAGSEGETGDGGTEHTTTWVETEGQANTWEFTQRKMTEEHLPRLANCS